MSNDDKLDRIADELVEIKIILTKQEGNLAEHMRRTELLEDALLEHDKLREDLENKLLEKIEPIEQFKDRIDGALKLIGLIAVSFSIVTSIVKIIEYLKN